MTGTRQRLPAAERRDLVLEAAATAFAERGYEATTTADVARTAGVSQPYVVRLFGTKQALFMAVTERCFDRVEGAFRQAAATAAPGCELDAIADAYGGLLANRRDLRLQLHAYAACEDPAIAETVRRRYTDLVHLVHEASGVAGEGLLRFFAHGMMLNVLAATGMIAMRDDPVLGPVVRAATDPHGPP